MPAPLLIALPDGLGVSGVASWAVRLASALAARGRAVALLLHPEPPAQRPVEHGIDPRVRVLHPTGLDRCGDRPGDLARPIAAYRDAARSLACDFGGPVILCPNLHGDCYGTAAALCLADPELVRIVGWCHSDNGYDARVLAHYEPVISKFVAVSDRVEAELRGLLPARHADIANIPCGVECPEPRATDRATDFGSAKSVPLRLIYTGRVEHHPKRVMALVSLSDALSARGVEHSITVAGDGPAMDELRAAADGKRIRLLGALAPGAIPALLADHDLFILPSRFEGLSVSMLEAMAAGCIPIVARTESGAAQVIERGWNGEIADIAPEADEEQTGRALAEAALRALKRGLPAMSEAAAATIRERFSLGQHVERAARLLDEAAAAPARPWPADRPCAFTRAAAMTARDGPAAEGSGSVPPGGAEKLRAVLRQLAGRAIVIHGAGEHTRQLAPILADSPARIVALADDDRAKHGKTLWGWPILAPADAAKAGATDVVISSWMHEAAIWDRRAVYERQGLRVWRLHE